MPQYRRLRRIIEMVKAGGRSGRSPTMADFRRELEASRRTITRDLDFLRPEEGAPITYDPKGRGYRLTDETFALPPVEMSKGDLTALAAARAVLRDGSGAHGMDTAFGKITEAAPGSYAHHIGHVDERFGALHEGHARIRPDTWATLADAVASSRVIAARYRRFDGTERDYLIEPLRLVAHRAGQTHLNFF